MEANPHNLDVFPPGLRGRRILLCTESLGPVNGVSRTTMMLVNQLRSHGAAVSVVAPYNHTKVNTFKPISPDATTPLPYKEEVRLAGYPLPFNPELSVAYPFRLSELYKQTFGGPPELIYLASPASLGFQVMLQLQQYGRHSRVPIICNFQTDLAGYCTILFPWPLGGIANQIFALVQGYLFGDESVRTVFYPSNFVKKYLRDVTGVPEKKMDLLRRGVDTENFSTAKRSEELRKKWAPNGELVLFTCSRLAGEKGFKFLAEAAKELDRRGMEFKLVVVGGNRNPVVEQEVKDMFTPLKDKVIFAGFKVGEELATHYASADIFLHCSITETFGLVVLEAMASGLPVIARDEGGPSDIVEHGNTGFLVPPNDLEEFVAKVLELGNHPVRRSSMAAESRAYACEATWERVSNKAAWKMYDTIIQSERDGEVGASTTQLPINGRPIQIPSVRQHLTVIITELKQAFAFSTILAFWTVVGSYLIFAEAGHFIKTHGPFSGTRAKVTH
ncbi:glycosyltransferase family 4 protein [Hypoxylon rubiginosum]|uniref:Glycosyltransferase family 4 protein n=1 Tax=Hypoxylon rubiginosum TaxID=110542 RepID=A0ACB9YZN8_9PEZI|nr:glycosyltransferase family 4 protein [Hypoxylon rubiginosum]